MKNTNINARSIPSQGAVTQLSEVEPLSLVHRIISAGLNAKGADVSVLDIREVFDITDYFIVFSGRSDRHTQGIANQILECLKEQGIEPEFVEGYDKGHWILIDCIDFVVHIFYEPVREQYDLEGLWVQAQKYVVGEDEKLEAA